MILYLDTSALVKLFVPEEHSESVRSAVAVAGIVATHVLAYVEACSAFSRLAEAREDKSVFRRLRRALDARWAEWEIVQVEEQLVRRAGEFCSRFHLRGYDSVHLAAAERVYSVSRAHAEFRLGVYDDHLRRAAKGLGLSILNE